VHVIAGSSDVDGLCACLSTVREASAPQPPAVNTRSQTPHTHPPLLLTKDVLVRDPALLCPCRNGTWCICWSPSNEYQLFSGDGSGAVRLWDIRRSGCRALLDFNTTQRPRLTAHPALHRATSQNTSGRKRNRTRDLWQVPEPGHGVESSPYSSNTANGAALAHEGAVTDLLATHDGLNLVTAGSDHRMRLWDARE
jgi:WD40 repeat protein